MSKQLWRVLSAILMVTILLAACASAGAPATLTTDPVQATTAAPTALAAQPMSTLGASSTATPTDIPITAAALTEGASMKVGLVTNTGGVDDHAFNQLAWEGMQKAAEELGFE